MTKQQHPPFTAGRAAFAGQAHVGFIQWMGGGPSMRARARFALIAVFLVTVPIGFVGMLRVSAVSEYATDSFAYDLFWQELIRVKLAVHTFETVLLKTEIEPNIKEQENLERHIIQIQEAFLLLPARKPPHFIAEELQTFQSLARQMEEAFLESKKDRQNIRDILSALSQGVDQLQERVYQIAKEKAQEGRLLVSRVARDQLVLFLVLLFAFAAFFGFVPDWLVSPLERLRKIEQWIQEGRLREMSILGNDEVSRLARILRQALLWREELDQKKSAKIFEIRNVLRASIAHVKEPIFIIDKGKRINYTNAAAAELLGVEPYYLEGTLLLDHIFCPPLLRAMTKAMKGDVAEAAMRINLELRDGRVILAGASFAAVQDREGDMSRIVLVLYPSG